MNRLQLQATLVERAAPRYTPAGLPALDVKLAHSSQVEHAGQPRQVALEIHATAIGEMASQLGRLAIGDSALFSGFLGRQRSGRGVMFHISSFESVPVPHTSAS